MQIITVKKIEKVFLNTFVLFYSPHAVQIIDKKISDDKSWLDYI